MSRRQIILAIAQSDGISSGDLQKSGTGWAGAIQANGRGYSHIYGGRCAERFFSRRHNHADGFPDYRYGAGDLNRRKTLTADFHRFPRIKDWIRSVNIRGNPRLIYFKPYGGEI